MSTLPPASWVPSLYPHALSIERATLVFFPLDTPLVTLISAFEWDEETRAAYATLPNARRQKEWLAQRLIVAQRYGKSVTLRHTASGKPYLEGSEEEVSVSHNHRFVVMAFSPTPIGIDLEHTDRITAALVKRILTHEEATTICWDHQNDWKKYWVGKEAAYKLFATIGIRTITEISLFRSKEDAELWSAVCAVEQQTATLRYLAFDNQLLALAF